MEAWRAFFRVTGGYKGGELGYRTIWSRMRAQVDGELPSPASVCRARSAWAAKRTLSRRAVLSMYHRRYRVRYAERMAQLPVFMVNWADTKVFKLWKQGNTSPPRPPVLRFTPKGGPKQAPRGACADSACKARAFGRSTRGFQPVLLGTCGIGLGQLLGAAFSAARFTPPPFLPCDCKKRYPGRQMRCPAPKDSVSGGAGSTHHVSPPAEQVWVMSHEEADRFDQRGYRATSSRHYFGGIGPYGAPIASAAAIFEQCLRPAHPIRRRTLRPSAPRAVYGKRVRSGDAHDLPGAHRALAAARRPGRPAFPVPARQLLGHG